MLRGQCSQTLNHSNTDDQLQEQQHVDEECRIERQCPYLFETTLTELFLETVVELGKNGEPSRAMVRPVDVNIVRDKLLAVGTKKLLLIRDGDVHSADIMERRIQTRAKTQERCKRVMRP